MSSLKEDIENFLVVWKYHRLELLGKLIPLLILLAVLSALYCSFHTNCRVLY